jgi:hypothetical protein
MVWHHGKQYKILSRSNDLHGPGTEALAVMLLMRSYPVLLSYDGPTRYLREITD